MNSQTGIALLMLFASSACIAAASPASQESTPNSPATEQVTGVGAPDERGESRWQLGIALGYGLRTNPLVQSDDIPIIVDIDIAWFGDHFFFDNGDFGLTFVDNERVTTSVVARVNSDRVFFGRTNTKFVTVDLAGQTLASAVQLSIPDRDFAAELGIEMLADGRWGRLQLTAHHDISGTHNGYEIAFDYVYGWRNQRWYFEPSFGLSYKSEALNNYYWGVRPGEANEALPAYEAGSGTNAHARLQFGYQISRHWSFAMVGEFERLNDEAAASPIVDERNVFGYFAGFGYRFR